MITTVGQIARDEDMSFLKMWRTNVDPAMRIPEDHRHGNFEIALVTAGGGVYQTVGGTHPICPGDVFVFPSNEPHWILEIHGSGLELYNLHFNHGFFRNGCTIGRRYPNLFFAHSPQFCGRIPAAQAGELKALMEAVRTELEGGAPEFETFAEGHVNSLFARLVRSHGYYRPEEGTHTAVEKIQPSLRFIDAHFAEDITLEEIAAESGLSPCYFTKVFKDCFRVKLWDHVLSKRIDAAKGLLNADSELTVLDVAMRCGFHNSANFNRAFLRFTGMTPSEYKRGVPLH